MILNKQEAKTRLGEIARLTLAGNLLEALERLDALSRDMNERSVKAATEKLHDNYTAMLRYLASGAVDPQRDRLRDTLTSDILALGMRLSRMLGMEDSGDIYFSTARAVLSDSVNSISKLVDDYKNEILRLEEDFDSLTDVRRTLKAEQLLRDLFNRIWVSHPLTVEDFEAIERMMSPLMPRHARASVISAVGLGHINYYDSKRLAWLLAKYVEYSETEPDLGLRALVEAMISMVRYKKRPISGEVSDVLATASEQPKWDKDFTTVAIELMRASDTKRISDKITKDWNSLDKDLREKLQNGEIDMEAIGTDFNPEWAEKLENSPIGKNMRELVELQAEGSDVFMASFSRMKWFPFFHELPNWFLPFYEGHSTVASVDTDDGFLSAIFNKLPIFCDSDKYSLIMGMGSMDEAQRKQMLTAIGMQSEQLRESLSELEKASDDVIRRNIVNKYVQNYYRVVNVFRSKEGLYDVFTASGQRPDLLQIAALKGNPENVEMLETIAEFYFKSHFWDEAVNAFTLVDSQAGPEARRAQEKAYAAEMSGDLENALRYYEEAEIIDGGTDWTIRRMARLLRRIGLWGRAADYFKRMADKKPEDAGIAIEYALALSSAGRYEEAEQAFHKAIYLADGDPAPKRGFAKVLFMSGKHERASEIYEELLTASGEPEDYMNAAFVKWAAGQLKDAIALFRMYTQDAADRIDLLEAEILNRSQELEKAGVPVDTYKYMTETLRFLSKE